MHVMLYKRKREVQINTVLVVLEYLIFEHKTTNTRSPINSILIPSPQFLLLLNHNIDSRKLEKYKMHCKNTEPIIVDLYT